MLHWLQLSLTDGLGPILQSRLIDACGSAEQACRISESKLRTIDGIGSAKARDIFRSLTAACDLVDTERRLAEKAGARIICRDDSEYPPLLREIPDPPAVLYLKGSIEPRDLNSIAIVGSRKCSHYGREQAERFAALLSGAAITVTSGGARGVDASAHRGALSHPQGRTIAVLGCGIDIVYPPENDALFRQIAARGAVVSEYPMSTPPVATNFPRRNRIVSGMSRGVLVVEADARSGALITARQANEDHGRVVFAIPGRVDNPLSIGPHQLIRDGATLVTGIEDIIEGLGPLPQAMMDLQPAPADEIKPQDDETVLSRTPPPSLFALSAEQSIILKFIDDRGSEIDEIVDRTSLPAHRVLQELTFLTLRGMVRRVDGKAFATSAAREAVRG